MKKTSKTLIEFILAVTLGVLAGTLVPTAAFTWIGRCVTALAILVWIEWTLSERKGGAK